MKKTLLVMMTGVLAIGMTAFAQEKGNRGTRERATDRQQQRQGRLAEVDLTPEQKAQVKAIREAAMEEAKQAQTPEERMAIRRATMEKVNAVLTEEQRSKIAASQPARPGPRAQGQRAQGPFEKLNLTDEQRAQVREIMTAARKEAQSAETPEARREIMTAAREKTKALLTEEQLKSLNEGRETGPREGQNPRQRMQQRRAKEASE